MKPLHECIFCEPLVEVRRAKIIKNINNKYVNKIQKIMICNGYLRKRIYLKELYFVLK